MRNKSQWGVEMSDVRMPSVADKFYPGDPARLKKMINDLIKAADVPEPEGKLRGIIVPHAGYVYSAPVASYAYKLLEKENPKKILMLGPSHYAHFLGLAESGYAGWNTPFGIVNTYSIRNDSNQENIHVYPAVHDPEHSLEVQVPFIQHVMHGKDYSIDPILTGEMPPLKGAEVLENPAEDSFLVVSSDLSHYLPYSDAVERDKNTVSLMESLDIEGFLNAGDACGKMGISIAIELARKKDWKIQALYYANSGDTAGPKSEVVGYAALAIIE